jgi:hypothetical protein
LRFAVLFAVVRKAPRLRSRFSSTQSAFPVLFLVPYETRFAPANRVFLLPRLLGARLAYLAPLSALDILVQSHLQTFVPAD